MANQAYSDLVKSLGHNNQNMGGTSIVAYLTSVSKLTTIQDVDTTTGAGDQAKITANHIWANANDLIPVYSTPEKAMYEHPSQGARSTGSFINRAKRVIPGMSAELAESLSILQNDDVIAWVKSNNKDAAGNELWIQIGSKDQPARVIVNGGTGEGPGGELQSELVIEAFSHRTHTFYEGTFGNVS